jgi:4-hydroxy-tetrahydrodipicolinate synthase
MSLERQFYAIAPTQFTLAGGLDAGATSENVERATEMGVSRFLLTGAYGEFQSLEDHERVSLVEAVKLRCPQVVVMAGAVHPSTDATLHLARRLFESGADEVMVGPPSMSEIVESDVLRHFAHLDAHADGSLVVYNNVVFGTDLSPGVVSVIADMPSYGAIKQGTSSIARMLDTVAAARHGSNGMRVLAASDITALATLAAGVDGMSSTNFWAFPEAFLTIARTAATADHEIAEQTYSALAPFLGLARAIGQPRAIKSVMTNRGFAGTSAVRLPYEVLSADENHQLETAVEAADAALATIGASSL